MDVIAIATALVSVLTFLYVRYDRMEKYRIDLRMLSAYCEDVRPSNGGYLNHNYNLRLKNVGYPIDDVNVYFEMVGNTTLNELIESFVVSSDNYALTHKYQKEHILPGDNASSRLPNMDALPVPYLGTGDEMTIRLPDEFVVNMLLSIELEQVHKPDVCINPIMPRRMLDVYVIFEGYVDSLFGPPRRKRHKYQYRIRMDDISRGTDKSSNYTVVLKSAPPYPHTTSDTEWWKLKKDDFKQLYP